ncbi:Imm53 family immunity protein [Lysobacter sp. CA199]|uniref:Imm53 family immunity protein n=1 Tax=Lysobacter sp. CA199 TaxID=3455608 RepID=UPI003F8D8A24
MSAIVRLQQWYTRQNQGRWEDDAIVIKTFANPCWFVSIRLSHTALDGAQWDDTDEGIAETPPWARCYIEQNVWKGAGDDLERLIELFLASAQSHERPQ